MEKLYRNALIKILAAYDNPEVVRSLASFALDYTNVDSLIVTFIPEGHKLYTIKYIREATGLSPKEAKDVSEGKRLHTTPKQLALLTSYFNRLNVQYTIGE